MQRSYQLRALVLCAAIGSGGASLGAPSLVRDRGAVVVTGDAYRATYRPETLDLSLEVRTRAGEWSAVSGHPGDVTFSYARGGREYLGQMVRTTWAVEQNGDVVTIGRQAVINPLVGSILELHTICTDSGLLMGVRVEDDDADGDARIWCPPRLRLASGLWDGYTFWDAAGGRHAGRMSELGREPVYAGVSPWDQAGDTVQSLDADRPALIARSEGLGVGLGVVFLGYGDRWQGSGSFLQRHTPETSYLYAGYAPSTGADRRRWAWLAPFPETADEEAVVQGLLRGGTALAADFSPIAPPVPAEWHEAVADFPAALRRSRPVTDVSQAVVYTINEPTHTDDGLAIAAKVGSDVLIRGWFKWGQAEDVARLSDVPLKAHAMGALFGGGITCSALYDGENGLSDEQWRDMPTRGPAGQLIDAWDTPGIRHGSLSSPAYLDYLFRWCREQIDAGVDYLFMDEITAALGRLEGYDDHSLADFRRYLLEACPLTADWTPDDQRWADLDIELSDGDIAPTGTMASFDYRSFLRSKGLLENPSSPDNPLQPLWAQFRLYRDDRAWKSLADRIRQYAAQQGRTIYISANGLAKYVDLQVLGVWGRFALDNGHIDLRESQLPVWRSIVTQGQAVAGKPVPVVLFHDWGFGDPPFPFLALSPSEREVWMRTRGAEIYAAGGFLAFPVLGPFGCDASRDGTLREIRRQTVFYQQNRDLYLQGRYLGSESLAADVDNLSLAAWWWDAEHTLAVHVINRNLDDGGLVPQRNVTLSIPVDARATSASVISPDWEGSRPLAGATEGGAIRVVLPALEAYAVALLHFDGAVDLERVTDPVRIRPAQLWSRPSENEFAVRPDRLVDNAAALNGFLQGMLHTDLRNPPTFLADAAADAELLMKVRAVSMGGATIRFSVDGEEQSVVDLPDRDGKNDGQAAEYDQVLSFPLPAGRHRLLVENTGADWATVEWYEFRGEFAEYR